MEGTGFLTRFLILSSLVGFITCTLKGKEALMPDIDGKILDMKNCSADAKYPIYFKDIKIAKKTKNVYTIAGAVQCMEEIPGPIKVVNKVHACGTVKNPKCEFFTNVVSDNACDELDQKKGQMYETLKVVNMEHQKCPFHPETYIIEPYDMKLPDDTRLLIPKSEYWEIKMTLTCGEKLLSCVDVKLEVKPQERERERNKKKGK